MFDILLSRIGAEAADDAVRGQAVSQELCAKRGLAACYMAAKFVGTGDSFSGCTTISA